MTRPKHPRAAQLRDLAMIVAAIEVENDPEKQDIASSIVDIELARLVEETWDSEGREQS
jgi:hypothetical protein